MTKILIILATLVFSLPTQAKDVYFDGLVDEKIATTTIKSLAPGDRLILNSSGGNLQAAYRLSEFIRANLVNTHVNSTGRCQSACVLIYAAGVQRTAGMNSMFFLHIVRDSKGNGDTSATIEYLGQLMKYGMNKNITLIPIVEDTINLDYATAKFVGLVTK